MTTIQVCGCTDDGLDVTPFESNQKATFYAIYISTPDGLFNWGGDFDTREDALEAAHAAITQGVADVLDDKTFDEAPK